MVSSDGCVWDKDINVRPISEIKLGASGETKTFSVHTLIQGNHVQILSGDKKVIDDCTVPGNNNVHSRLAIKTDYPFLVKIE
jgi:hypothetical protein